MGSFNKRFNKDATPTNALKLTTDLGLCCDEGGAICQYVATVDIDTAINGIMIGGKEVEFADVTEPADVVVALNAAMLAEGYVGAFSLSETETTYAITATSPVELLELFALDNIPFVQKCTEAIVCDYKINYKSSDTETGSISYDGGVTESVLPFGNFAVQTPETMRADIEPTLPVGVELTSVVKNEDLVLFELVFSGVDSLNIIMNGALGETIAEKCNCAAGWISLEEVEEGVKPTK